MDLIDCEIEDGGQGREEIQKQTYDDESEDIHGNTQAKEPIRIIRKSNKSVLQIKKNRIPARRLNHRIQRPKHNRNINI